MILPSEKPCYIKKKKIQIISVIFKKSLHIQVKCLENKPNMQAHNNEDILKILSK